MRSLRRNLRALSAACCAAGAALCLLAGSAQAATVYPPGGGAFNGGPEGWHLAAGGAAACSPALPLFCTPGSEFVPNNGNPGGAWEQRTSFLLNAFGLIKGSSTVESPNFTVTEGGAATFHLERQLTTDALVNVSPTANYVVKLIDHTTGVESQILADTTSGNDPAYVGKDSAATLTAGHTYAISIAAETSTQLVSLSLGAATNLRFDNVRLTVGTSNTPGGGGNDGGSNDKNTSSSNKTSTSNNHNRNSRDRGGSGGGSHLSNTRLRVLIRKGATAAPVQLRGNRLLVKVNCPAKVGRACRIVAQGMLNRRRAATSRRVVKVARGKGKRIVLHVKRKARKRVAKRKRLLVRQKVRAGKAHVTIYKSRKLIRRHPRR